MKKYNTILFVPHARAPFRKITISSRSLTFLAAGAGLVVLSALLFGWAYLSNAGRDREYRRQLDENARLRSTSVALAARLQGISRQLDEFDTRTRRLAIVAGLTEAVRGGLGGPLTKDSGDSPLFSEKTAVLGSRVAALESQFARRSAIASSTPTVAPVRGLLNSGFGSRKDPFTGEGAFHQGLDISTRRHEPVLATGAGVVVKSGWNGDYGKAVAIAHGTGYTTIYGHLDSILVKEGQQVRRGDRLGLVGSTGRTTGPHLHYEVRQGDRAVNPLEYILDTR